MAAIFAASSDARTILLERTPDGGRKILISGGGRCNVLPSVAAPGRFVTDSTARTLQRMLRSWPLREQILFFEGEAGLPLAEERESGKLFPVSNRARDVRDALQAVARRRGVEILTDTLVTDLEPFPRGWRLHRDGRPPLEAEAVVVASGGQSIPKSGSDGRLLPVLDRLGHPIHEPYPALTPLLAPPSPFSGLAGVSLTVTLTAASPARTATATGGFLFTHRGYSGPAVLDVSHVPVGGPSAALRVRWSDRDERSWTDALRPSGARTLLGALRAQLPERLASALCATAGVEPGSALARMTREQRQRMLETLLRCALPWSGHEGYAKAEVTGGGVDLDALNPTTMESRLRPGLFLCGEILDAFGPIGGHNFQWAWATGRAAGIGAAEYVAPSEASARPE
jgi:predicted Rossmann fold flavoprotein